MTDERQKMYIRNVLSSELTRRVKSTKLAPRLLKPSEGGKEVERATAMQNPLHLPADFWREQQVWWHSAEHLMQFLTCLCTLGVRGGFLMWRHCVWLPAPPRFASLQQLRVAAPSAVRAVRCRREGHRPPDVWVMKSEKKRRLMNRLASSVTLLPRWMFHSFT